MPVSFPDGQESWRVFRIMAEFVEGFEVLADVGKAVTIFGSARTRPNNPFYHAAEETSKLLAKAGFAVVTGGGPGIMEADKGAFELGSPSIGLNITLPHEQDSNRYQTVSLDFHYFYARKVMFVKYASAFICFPGGYGTLDELFETLTLVQTTKVESAATILLYGSDYWGGLVYWMRKTLMPSFIDGEDLDIFKIVDTPAEAVKWVKHGIKRPWWKPKNREMVEGVGDGTLRNRPPVAGAKAARTGEGTRYGKRPHRTQRAHAKPPLKPQQ